MNATVTSFLRKIERRQERKRVDNIMRRVTTAELLQAYIDASSVQRQRRSETDAILQRIAVAELLQAYIDTLSN